MAEADGISYSQNNRWMEGRELRAQTNRREIREMIMVIGEFALAVRVGARLGDYRVRGELEGRGGRSVSRLVAVDHPDVATLFAMAPHRAAAVGTRGAGDAQLRDLGAVRPVVHETAGLPTAFRRTRWVGGEWVHEGSGVRGRVRRSTGV